MYADPQTITWSGATLSLARLGSKEPSRLGTFSSASGNSILTTRQDKTANRKRHEIRFTSKKVAADPLSSANKEQSASAILVIDEPNWGFSDSDLGELTDTLIAWFTDENRDRLISGEL